jgi:hypothetical protein
MSGLRSVRSARFLLALLIMAAVAGFSGPGLVLAQDTVTCESPGLPPGEPTAMEEATPEAMDDMAMGTPEAMDETAEGEADLGMMAPPALPEGQPADPGVAALVNRVIENHAACYNEGQSTGDVGLYIALESDNFIMEMTGTGNPYDRVLFETEGPPVSAELVSISNPMTYDDGRISGDVEIILADHWFNHMRVFLSLADDLSWKWDQEAYLRPQPDAETVSVNGINITETVDESTGETTYAFELLGSPTIEQTEALIFNVTNSGAEIHEMVVVQLPEGSDPMGILDGSVAFEDILFYGVVAPIFPGETLDLALVNMEPGVYTILCFFPDEQGAPHAVNGMIGEFEIVPPADE